MERIDRAEAGLSILFLAGLAGAAVVASAGLTELGVAGSYALLFALMQLTRAAARLPASTLTLLLLGLIFAAPMGVVLLVRQMDVPPPIIHPLTVTCCSLSSSKYAPPIVSTISAREPS